MHSDRGSQYTSWAFGHRLRAAGLLGSMGRVASAVDHPMMESFFGTLQRELLGTRTWRTRAELASAIFEWIEGWYNPRRRHTSVGDLQPRRLRKQAHHRRGSGMMSTRELSGEAGQAPAWLRGTAAMSTLEFAGRWWWTAVAVVLLIGSGYLLVRVNQLHDSTSIAVGGDADAAASSAHTLKGASANLGATTLSLLAADIEREAGAAELQRARALADRAEDERDRVLAELDSIERRVVSGRPTSDEQLGATS